MNRRRHRAAQLERIADRLAYRKWVTAVSDQLDRIMWSPWDRVRVAFDRWSNVSRC